MTLIDKAEALAPCPFCGGGVSVTTTERVGGIVCDAPSECIGSGLLIVFDLEDMETALAAWNRRAIPARGVGVKPLVWQPIVKGARRPVGLVLLYRKSVTAEDKLVAAICKGTPEASDEILLGKWRDGAWRQWNTGWTVNGVTHWMPLPEPPEILAALAPTDAAQARDAALHPDAMLPEAIRLIRQEASRDHSQDVVTGLKHIALLLEQLIKEART